MALHAVQAAMKTLIVGGIDLPDSVVSRQQLYREIFPELSSEEVLDLASIPPHRLKIYTDSIFAAQSGILQRNFPCSVELVKHIWPTELFGSFSPYRLAQEVHTCAPWKGIHSDSLGESLVAFLTSTSMAPALRGSGVLDMAAFELASLRIRKAPSGGFVNQSRAAFEAAVAKASVAELLSRSLVVSPGLQVLSLSFDVLDYQRALREGSQPEVFRKRSHAIVGARPLDYGAAWHEVPALVSELLRDSAQSDGHRTVSVATLAEAFLPALGGEDDAAVFRAFMVHLGRLVEIGAVAGC
jgi:hypothetical protein